MILILTGFVIGLLVSLIEAACTGQVYVPVLALLAKAGQVKAWWYLLIYNLIFILPLLIILALSLWGVASERLQLFFKQRVALIKLATAVLFLAMALFLWIG